MQLLRGDCLEVMRNMPDASVDAVVTDPPYGLAFMGKDWDSFKATNEAQSQVVKGLGTGMRMTTLDENRNFQEWNQLWASECLRVLKPGGWLLAFSGSRTYHRLACAVEDAGFQVRDQMLWLYSTGFPKSMDVSKAIDKAAGAEREVIKQGTPPPANFKAGTFNNRGPNSFGNGPITAPATPEAQQWAGWGTALKPAHEPIVMARKPFSGTVAANVLEHGTGAINIGGCRVGDEKRTYPLTMTPGNFETTGGGKNVKSGEATVTGRWPANLIHDGSEPVQAVLGKASAYFYCPKANKKDRNAGLSGMPEKRPDDRTTTGMGHFDEKGVAAQANHHPTVKPTDLMRYLCRLVTPPGGTVLDPFMGSGSTGKAAVLEGFDFIGIERELEYVEIAKLRIAAALPEPRQPG